MANKLEMNSVCNDCGGSGKKSNIQGDPLGDCPNCKGTGLIEIGHVNAKKILDKLDEILALLA